MNKIKAIIFDMDGVLVDAKEWHYEALNCALSLFGYSISRYDHLITYDGLPTKKKLEMLTLERGLPLALHDFINEIKQLYTMEIVGAQCKPIFHLEYALSKLKALGYKLGVASNSIRKTVEIMLERSGIISYFDILLSNEDVNKPKPDPEIYVKAIDFLSLSPSECLIVEDNQHGIKAAKTSGGNVMIVSSVNDVNLENILKNLNVFERNI